VGGGIRIRAGSSAASSFAHCPAKRLAICAVLCSGLLEKSGNHLPPCTPRSPCTIRSARVVTLNCHSFLSSLGCQSTVASLSRASLAIGLKTCSCSAVIGAFLYPTCATSHMSCSLWSSRSLSSCGPINVARGGLNVAVCAVSGGANSAASLRRLSRLFLLSSFPTPAGGIGLPPRIRNARRAVGRVEAETRSEDDTVSPGSGVAEA